MSRLIFLVFFSFALASASFLSINKVSVAVSETKGLKNKPSGEALGVVNPTPCGGVGSLNQMRVSGCNAFPCSVNTDTEIELDFTPANNANTPMARLTVTLMGVGPISSEQPMANPLVAGQSQTYKVPLLEFEQLQKIHDVTIAADIDAKIEIIGDQSRVEICTSGEFNIGIGGGDETTPRGGGGGGFAAGLSASSHLVMSASVLLFGVTQLIRLE